MTNQEKKLEQVKKSTRVTMKVLHIIRVILIVGCILSTIAAVGVGISRPKLNNAITESIANGNGTFSYEEDFGNIGIFSVDFDAQRLIDQGDYAAVILFVCIYAAIVCAIVAVFITMIHKVFATLDSSETPFCPAVLTTLRRSFIILTILSVFMCNSLAITAILALTFWCIYTILDYGMTLQIEVDETL